MVLVLSCTGANGGTTAGCAATLQATPIDGVCGSSNGGIFTAAPSAGLCSADQRLRSLEMVPGLELYGANGGATAGCAATLQATYVG